MMLVTLRINQRLGHVKIGEDNIISELDVTPNSQFRLSLINRYMLQLGMNEHVENFLKTKKILYAFFNLANNHGQTWE